MFCVFFSVSLLFFIELENNEQSMRGAKCDEKVLIAFIVRKMDLMKTLKLFHSLPQITYSDNSWYFFCFLVIKLKQCCGYIFVKTLTSLPQLKLWIFRCMKTWYLSNKIWFFILFYFKSQQHQQGSEQICFCKPVCRVWHGTVPAGKNAQKHKNVFFEGLGPRF